MLAPLARLTLIVVAALLISFVDETLSASATNAGSDDVRMLLLNLDDDEQAVHSGVTIDRIGQQEGGATRAFTVK